MLVLARADADEAPGMLHVAVHGCGVVNGAPNPANPLHLRFQNWDGSHAVFERLAMATISVPSGIYSIEGNYRIVYTDPKTKEPWPCTWIETWVMLLPGDVRDVDLEVPTGAIVDPLVPVLYDGIASPGVGVSAVHFANAIPCGGTIAGDRTELVLERTKIGYYGDYSGPSESDDWAGIALRVETTAGPRYVRIGAPQPEAAVGVPPSTFRFDLTADHLATIATFPPNVLGC